MENLFGRSILIVDDEPLVLEMVGRLLSRAGFEDVHLAETAEEAYRIIRHYDISLVLLDINLSQKENGIELLGVLKKLYGGSLGIIMMTGFASYESALAALRGKADDYVEKPLDSTELIDRVKHVLFSVINQRTTGKLPKEKKRRIYDVSVGSSGRLLDHILSFGSLVLNCDTFVLERDGEEIEFSEKEFCVFKMLMENPGKVIGKKNLSKAITDGRQLRDIVYRLRKKVIGEDGHSFAISYRSGGYILEYGA